MHTSSTCQSERRWISWMSCFSCDMHTPRGKATLSLDTLSFSLPTRCDFLGWGSTNGFLSLRQAAGVMQRAEKGNRLASIVDVAKSHKLKAILGGLGCQLHSQVRTVRQQKSRKSL